MSCMPCLTLWGFPLIVPGSLKPVLFKVKSHVDVLPRSQCWDQTVYSDGLYVEGFLADGPRELSPQVNQCLPVPCPTWIVPVKPFGPTNCGRMKGTHFKWMNEFNTKDQIMKRSDQKIKLSHVYCTHCVDRKRVGGRQNVRDSPYSPYSQVARYSCKQSLWLCQPCAERYAIIFNIHIDLHTCKFASEFIALLDNLNLTQHVNFTFHVNVISLT